jgi:hypothetical protein
MGAEVVIPPRSYRETLMDYDVFLYRACHAEVKDVP